MTFSYEFGASPRRSLAPPQLAAPPPPVCLDLAPPLSVAPGPVWLTLARANDMRGWGGSVLPPFSRPEGPPAAQQYMQQFHEKELSLDAQGPSHPSDQAGSSTTGAGFFSRSVDPPPGGVLDEFFRDGCPQTLCGPAENALHI